MYVFHNMVKSQWPSSAEPPCVIIIYKSNIVNPTWPRNVETRVVSRAIGCCMPEGKQYRLHTVTL